MKATSEDIVRFAFNCMRKLDLPYRTFVKPIGRSPATGDVCVVCETMFLNYPLYVVSVARFKDGFERGKSREEVVDMVQGTLEQNANDCDNLMRDILVSMGHRRGPDVGMFWGQDFRILSNRRLPPYGRANRP